MAPRPTQVIDGTIPLPPATTRRFFLPVILLKSLLKVFKKEKAIRVLDDPRTAPVDIFETFVNKLGHICDSAKGGDKVTAFAVLQLGVIQYYFTSNRRDEQDYQRTAHYITDVLQTLGEASEEGLARRQGNASPSTVFLNLLRKIIRFNESRISGYLFSMSKNLDFCISNARGYSTDDAQRVLPELERLQALLEFLHESPTIDQFVEGSQAVLRALDTMYHQQAFKDFLFLRTQNNTESDAPWVVVSHSIGRLLSYYYAVDFFLKARRRWPQLFDDFEVHWVPSAEPTSPTIPRAKLDAAMIIGKMWNGPQKTEYCKYAAALEQSNISLNTEITRIAKTFTTIVHAEVNLLAHILRLQRTLRAQGQDVPVFFNNTKYIGCSKPTCRFCELWFGNHPSGVRVREGHRNLYAEWRAPDVLEADGASEAQAREAMLNRIIPLIKDQVADDLRERCATRTLNDSNDNPTNLPLTGTDVTSTRLPDLVSKTGRMELADMEGRKEGMVARGQGSVGSGASLGPRVPSGRASRVIEDDDDDDDRGASL